jgi:hypothetical protein
VVFWQGTSFGVPFLFVPIKRPAYSFVPTFGQPSGVGSRHLGLESSVGAPMGRKLIFRRPETYSKPGEVRRTQGGCFSDGRSNDRDP